MKTKITLSILVVVVLFQFFISCVKEVNDPPKSAYLDLPATPYFYEGGDSNTATLGRVLFYDRQLSINNSISCGSCHKQAFAFADNSALSFGFEHRLTKRNTPPIQNLSGSDIIFFQEGDMFKSFIHLFWDGRDSILSNMVMKPILNHVEMGIGDVNSLPGKLSAIPYYKDLFQKAFASDEITVEKISEAMAAFVQSISSRQSKFEQSLLGIGSLNAMEEEGHQLFFNKYNCNNCHHTEMPNGYQFGEGDGFVNIGLDAVYPDIGRSAVTGNSADMGKFKIPDLRNVALTVPYMHDGRFKTLNEVLSHYSHSIADHPNLDHRLRDVNHQPMRMNISNHEQEAIIAFLRTLTDFNMVTDPKFSDPFKVR